MTLYLIRHAHAGSRHKWSGPDDQRPLSAKGEAQAARLADQFADAGITRVITSPSLRCRQTVEPLALRLGIPIEEDESLAEGAAAAPGLGLLHRLADEEQNVALCSHGDVIPELIHALEREGLDGDGHEASAKAGAFVLDTDGRRLVHASYVPPPDLGAGVGQA